MVTLVVIMHVLVSLFLIAVILLQAGRGQGLSWGVFGGTPQSILGTKTASFLTRVTSVCAILFLFTCIGLNIVELRKSRSLLAPSKGITKLDLSKLKELEKTLASKTRPAEQAELSETAASPEAKSASEISSAVEAAVSQPAQTNPASELAHTADDLSREAPAQETSNQTKTTQ
jgi:preprotein translocase subunit SecG